MVIATVSADIKQNIAVDLCDLLLFQISQQIDQ